LSWKTAQLAITEQNQQIESKKNSTTNVNKSVAWKCCSGKAKKHYNSR